MPVQKELSSIKRFGARYGRRLKYKFAQVEALHRQTYKCPYCSYTNVKRVARGIWQCSKCNAKFASKAYTITKKKTAKELAREMAVTAGAAEETAAARPSEKEMKEDEEISEMNEGIRI